MKIRKYVWWNDGIGEGKYLLSMTSARRKKITISEKESLVVDLYAYF